MPKLTLTSTFASPLVVGDPGAVTINLNPKETKSVEVSKDHLPVLLPGLEKLKTAGWLTFVVGDAVEVPATPKAAAPPPPPPPATEPTPVVEEAPAASAEEAAPVTSNEEAPAPSAPKAPFFDRKNRNR
jgi:hypothetical protein